jgi:hypothetical protein
MPFTIQPYRRFPVMCIVSYLLRANSRIANPLRVGLITTLLVGCGISATSIYPGTGLTFDLNESGVKILGEVNTCQGGFCKNDETGRTEWPLSLAVPPPASHYQAALRKKAARVYNVPERDIVLGEITVDFYNELNGTVRGWQAKTIAGRRSLSE